MSEELMHYGTPRHSGRYPWGSGDDPYQHESSFLSTIKELQGRGFTEKEIADYLGMSTTQLRERKAYERAQEKQSEYALMIKLRNEGYSNTAIAEKLGKSEGYVRYALKNNTEERAQVITNVAEVLKENVADKKYIDIGPGTNLYMGNVSEQKLDAAVRQLRDEEGYEVRFVKVEQAGNPGKYTTIKVLCAPGTDYKEVYQNRDQISYVGDKYTNDGGKTFLGIEPPTSVDSSRIAIRYKEDGGADLDGVIQLRPGVEDISLGNANYAQVRIAVDGTHYLKGMAMYSDDLPDGVDILFNTNKKAGTPMCGEDKNNTVLKLLDTKNPDNPFGSTLRMEDGKIVGQRHYTDENGNDKLSPINIVRQEGDWDTWSDTLSSQFLSKQPYQLINQQLNKTYEDKKSQFESINLVTQPEVKKKLLMEFAEDCDASASHLKAAALPRQSSKVILPLTELSEKEIYAPTYRDGEQVALIRYPHGGTFEIPLLTVNNKGPGKKELGNAIDAVGINSKVAERLSGADFDGDTVVVIPTQGQKIKSSNPLDGLRNFDPKESYPYVEGMKVLSKKQKQNEMGRVSNLITDMTIKSAPPEEIARAVRHSMVVIDAEKHKLNYKQSEIDNGIQELKEKYQKKPNGKAGGAATLISQSNAEIRIPIRKELSPDPETGERRYGPVSDKDKYREKIKVNKNGEKSIVLVENTETTTRMREEKDARNLSSGTMVENRYADYANSLKIMANEARKEAMNISPTKVSSSAKEVYKDEVESLNSKLRNALQNKPKERKAQALASVIIEQRKKSNPEIIQDNDQLKKVRTQALAGARSKTGASRRDSTINLTDKEWEALNSGAVSSSKVTQILSFVNPDKVKQLSMPRETKTLSTAQLSRIRSLEKNGYTLSQIADSLGVSTSTISKYLND